jgi:hypothetical protein
MTSKEAYKKFRDGDYLSTPTLKKLLTQLRKGEEAASIHPDFSLMAVRLRHDILDIEGYLRAREDKP